MDNSEKCKQDEENVIKSVSDAIKIVSFPCEEYTDLKQRLKPSNELSDICASDELFFPFGIWFRGQSNKKWTLEPKIFRNKNDDESSMLIQFQLNNPEYRIKYKNTFDWLCLGQHYGLPTRLLDWSDNILIALYFAVRNEERKEDGKLFILHGRRLNNYCIRPKNFGICSPENINVLIRSEMALCKEKDKFKELLETKRSTFIKSSIDEFIDIIYNNSNLLSTPIAVGPYKYDKRIISQSSFFTLHGGVFSQENCKEIYIGEPISLEKVNENYLVTERFLKDYVIPGKYKSKIKLDLERLNIHEGTVFPDLEHQVEYIKKVFTGY